MKLYVTKTNKGLIPAHDDDYEKYIKIPIGETFEIEFVKSRNYQFHKKFFVLLNLAFENQEAYKLFNSMREDIIIHAGYSFEETNFLTGEIKTKAKSIAFHNMDETEFSELYKDVKTVIINWLGIDDKAIEEEISQHF